MNTFTKQELQELGYESITDQMARDIIAESPDIQEQLVQEHTLITDAYNTMVDHQHKMKSSEWEPLENDVAFSQPTGPDVIHTLWDEHEMIHDMNAFEGDVNAQKHLASSGENGTRADVQLTIRGQNYSTGDTDMGKVYIPKHLTRFFGNGTEPKTCTIVYNGCEEARNAVNIRMPWKCVYVTQ
jgi:hypothetical protein